MKFFILFFLLIFGTHTFAQYNPDVIQSDVVLYAKRQSFDKYLRETVIDKTFQEPLDSNSEDYYESACLAISQFMITNDVVKAGFDSLYQHYDSLQYATKRAFIEAVYSVYPHNYTAWFKQLIAGETEPKLFCMQAVYLYKNDSSRQNIQQLERQIKKNFGANDTIFLLQLLKSYLNNEQTYKQKELPNINKLFAYRKAAGSATVYSFQRWNRDYPGIAVVQNPDGCFARDSAGRLLLFEQLARSASNMPYFISSGSTPQGIYSIWSTAKSINKIIGPSPNLQTVLPFEDDPLYWGSQYDSSKDALRNYIDLLPMEWRNYLPMLEAFDAGKAGRNAIIAHGTTIDPSYFKGKPYYPISPTLGCLCAKESWNMYTGKIVESDQLNLVNTFIKENIEETGFLFVINLDNQQKPVTKEEVEKMVNEFELNSHL
ncbi:hypothetical protein FC093_13305 [Ilyomonas limi]|uniref:Uncharacterized protein n=1 Tax=Ilyomonas limi TaxID=2575867 RepID=A0A4U3KZ61_9BACT|nr:hypothetical protein [Ilyomonas limi]TKK67722.1 hypothetical protein FC093_13305 [Ilyomonas limi]